MPKTMLIDATHAEETRVAVVDGNRLVEFDYESKVRKQLKGGIFLAKVTRVEPSLQAAFVNFGGNRHGFLPFSEIHPDYFRIPIADREALLAAQIAELEEHDEEMEQEEAAIEERAAQSESGEPEEDDLDDEEEEAIVEVGGEDQPLDEEDDSEHLSQGQAQPEHDEHEDDVEDEPAPRTVAMNVPSDTLEGPYMPEADHVSEPSPDDMPEELEAGDLDEQDDDHHDGEEISAEGQEEQTDGADKRGRGRGRGGRDRGRGRGRRGRNGHGGRGDQDDRGVDSLGGDGIEGDRPFRFNMRKNYKIQEVIKRGQIMLIQVSKEERGNKGAAVTTYLSLPGRYCVLMPNSPRGGGVSRKIASFKDRKRMKDMLDDLSVPEGMSVILRTAGVARTKVEIKRDLDYLTRLWNTIREHTLKSSAPALIYEEGSLIKRAIRDLYSRDIEDVYVQGDDGYKAAKEFMKMLMPSHAKKVQEYKNDRIPMFHKFGVESQIADIGEPTVNLRSGGYLVINPTEALVSVDVNSGRATKERHIEETALKTNLEAADEVARQLRLRDLGGLVVIDFIDMEDRRNNRKVEQRLRDALSSDRARIQVGRISSFGLLELSRQRLNPSLAEAQTEICAHCAGTGRTRTLDFAAISIIRALEAEGIKGKAGDIVLTMCSKVALYILNNKRRLLNDIEQRYDFAIIIETDESMSNTQFTLEALARSTTPKISEGIVMVGPGPSEDQIAEDDADGEEIEDEEELSEDNQARPSARAPRDGEEGGDDRPRRRRGRRGGRGRRAPREGGSDNDNAGENAVQGDAPRQDAEPSEGSASAEEGQSDSRPPRRDRGQNNRRHNNRDRRPRRDQGEGEGFAAPSDSAVSSERVAPAPVQHSVPETYVRPAPVSNDVRTEPPAPRDYETVNQAPEKKKKGWWNKLVE